MDIKEIAVDSARIEKGDWIGDLPEMGDVELHVRGIGNSDYRKLQQKLIEGVPRSKRVGGRISQEDNDRISNECLVETVLLGWRGITNGGKPLPFSKEKAREMIFEPDYRRFREAVIYAATLVADREDEAEKELSGN
jgi:hypothetical protein